MRRSHVAVAVALVALFVIGSVVYVELYRTRPASTFASEEDHFLYGSITTDAGDSIPYWIWLVLPRIFPEYLPTPGGYAAVGVLGKDGREMPIGFSKVTVGTERVAVNCAFCHTGSYRLRADEPRTIVPAAPAHQLAPQLYLRFLFDSVSDPRFTADAILDEIAKNYRLSPMERLAYRFVYIPSTRRSLIRLRDQLAWTATRPEWGFGRMDLFDAIRFGPLRQQVDDSIATADLPSLWNLGAWPGGHFWDGSNKSVDEAVLASAIGVGKIDRSSVQRVQRYIGTLKPPAFPMAIDRALASRGSTIFQAECASCHAPGRSGDAHTDPRRARTVDATTASLLNSYSIDGGSRLSGFAATGRYVTPSLDGIWMRGPFLHNGSVPTLDGLLKSQAERPRTFWRGYDVLDPDAVGFVSAGSEAQRTGTRFDTTLPGNSNAGHEFGIGLSTSDKRALLEYLKTL